MKVNKRKQLAILFVACLLCTCSYANTDSLIIKSLQSFPIGTQVSVAIIEQGKPTYIGYIVHETGILQQPLENAIFEIGSVTKTFTSALLAICIEKKLLQPSTNLSEVLPYTLPAEAGKITMQQLATHTSGLPRLPTNLSVSNPANPYKDYDTSMLYQYLKKARLNNEPGSKYEYSNTGAGLLGIICSNKLALSYEQALQQYIFKPLHMQYSFIDNNQNRAIVTPLDAAGELAENWDFDCLVGAGGIKSTVKDMVQYLLAQFDTSNRCFSICQQPIFTVNNRLSMGLGWHIIQSATGKQYLFHNGGTGGYTSSVLLMPEKQKAVVILSNVSAFHPKSSSLDQLSMALLDR